QPGLTGAPSGAGGAPAPGAQNHDGGAPAPGARDRRTLVAIGPEGGWTDAEVALLEAHGFDRLSLGPRILRTDTAAIALLARLMPTGQP
ncbi:MAG: RsmE family RNA methyltransferase, partial [Kiritimatiellae bacterium]|nr:RsmE family RNA methyltransferase [Kiritimatiellia bacterium]